MKVEKSGAWNDSILSIDAAFMACSSGGIGATNG
jgi:hypothetical protein